MGHDELYDRSATTRGRLNRRASPHTDRLPPPGRILPALERAKHARIACLPFRPERVQAHYLELASVFAFPARLACDEHLPAGHPACELDVTGARGRAGRREHADRPAVA